MKTFVKRIGYKVFSTKIVVCILNYLKLRGTEFINNKIIIGSKFVCKGVGNRLIFDDNGYLKNCSIHINGDNNIICIGKNTCLNNTVLWIEDSNNKITIGNNTVISGKTELACIESTSISIGDDCLFSANITMRTGDSHSIIDMNGSRVNPSQNIVIGNHVWVGNTVIVLKGVQVESDSIIGTGSVVTRSNSSGNVALGGNPAKVIKENVNWDKDRI